MVENFNQKKIIQEATNCGDITKVNNTITPCTIHSGSATFTCILNMNVSHCNTSSS